MTSFYMSPISAIFQYFTDIGVVLSGGKINTYLAGTATPTATYTDSTGTTPNANPIILGSNGRLNSVQVWQPGGTNLKIIVSDSNNNQLGPIFDQVSGINDPATTLSALGNAANGFGADIVANAVRSYDIVSSVRGSNPPNLSAGQTLVIIIEGANSPGDGGGGPFYWNSTSTATDDGVNVIKVLTAAVGRYLRILGSAVLAIKNANTSRASSTSATADPDLQISIVPGSYQLDMWINDSQGSTSAGGLKGTVAYSGSLSDGSFWAMQGGTGISNVPLVTINVVAQTFELSQSSQGNMFVTGSLIATSQGTLSFNWAQHSSNATASIVGAGSWMRVTRIK